MNFGQEKRKDRRVEFFLVPAAHKLFPVWVFKPENESEAHAGLILNISSGGVQILTDRRRPLEAGRYTLHVLSQEAEGAGSRLETTVARLWTHPECSLYERSGFGFESGADRLLQYLDAHVPQVEDHDWLRCTLTEAAQA